MGWLWVWLHDRQERRAEAAVRRQLAALEHERRVAELSRPPQVAALAHEYTRGLEDDGIDDAVAHDMLLAECVRADALAGRHGGFVSTARIRELLRGGR